MASPFAITERAYIHEHKGLVDKWEKLFFLSDKFPGPEIKGRTQLETDLRRAMMAQLLENTLLSEAARIRLDPRKAERLLSEDTLTGDDSSSKIPTVLGMVRSVFPRMVALDIVQTQAMDRPIGRVYYLDIVRESDDTLAGSNVNAYHDASWRSWMNDPGETSKIVRQVSMSLTSADVTATAHRLKTVVSVDETQDLAAYQGLSAPALLAEAAAAEAARELDQVILNALLQGASAGNVVFGGVMPSNYQNYGEYVRFELPKALNKVDQYVFASRYVGTNWIVCGPNIATEIQSINTFTPDGDFNPDEAAVGVQTMGTVGAKWRVYRNPWFPTNTALLGFRGNTWTNACYFFLPYVPFQQAGPDFFDPDTQKTTTSYLTRYATKLVNGAYMGKVTLNATQTGVSYPS